MGTQMRVIFIARYDIAALLLKNEFRQKNRMHLLSKMSYHTGTIQNSPNLIHAMMYQPYHIINHSVSCNINC